MRSSHGNSSSSFDVFLGLNCQESTFIKFSYESRRFVECLIYFRFHIPSILIVPSTNLPIMKITGTVVSDNSEIPSSKNSKGAKFLKPLQRITANVNLECYVPQQRTPFFDLFGYWDLNKSE